MTNDSKNQAATKEDVKKFRDDVKNYMGLLHEKFENEIRPLVERCVAVGPRKVDKLEHRVVVLESRV